MRRIYFIPANEVLVNGITYRAPKYLGGRNQPSPLSGLEVISGSFMDYGYQPVFLCVLEVTSAQHDIIAAQSDVLALPTDITQTMSANAVTQAQNFLETLYIPAGWIDTTMTYRFVLKKVAWIFQFMQRIHGLYPDAKVFTGGITLNTTFGSLPVAVQNAFINAANSFAFGTEGLNAGTTVRQILKFLADKFGDNPIKVYAGDL